jgi:hypothetical protein
MGLAGIGRAEDRGDTATAQDHGLGIQSIIRASCPDAARGSASSEHMAIPCRERKPQDAALFVLGRNSWRNANLGELTPFGDQNTLRTNRRRIGTGADSFFVPPLPTL